MRSGGATPWIRLTSGALLGGALLGCAAAVLEAETGSAAYLLGAAQDGGMPQLACADDCCRDLHRTGRRRLVAALGVRSGPRWWLFDATPDLTEQVDLMGSLPAGVFLTHAHVGHYTGLMYLGREGLSARRMPVHCSASMAEFLSRNGPWSQLVALEQIEIRIFQDGDPIELAPGLQVTPLAVPHRGEFSDTYAFLIGLGSWSMLYLPDIDRWDSWAQDPRELAATLDCLVLDGTFYSTAELPGRDRREIPHPPVLESMDLLQDAVDAGSCQVVFSHLNHSNPLWDAESPEAAALRRRGFYAASHYDAPPPGSLLRPPPRP